MMALPTKVFQIVSRLTRGKTLGARVAVIDDDSRILLVRHGYTAGWLLPGGGVERNETLRQAAIRELREEAAIEAAGPLHFHGMFSNDAVFPGDHVACFVLREFRQGLFKPSFEIQEAKFFAVADLPTTLTKGTQARINEIVHGAAISDFWQS